jgi:hypothetical protein
MCVQRFNDSRGYAIRITYRISLRSSSLWEPRHPSLKVVFSLIFLGQDIVRRDTTGVILLPTKRPCLFDFSIYKVNGCEGLDDTSSES